jgi:hypothetical protein
MKDFVPGNEEQRQGFEELKNTFVELTGKIREMPEEQRAPLLRIYDNKFVKSLYMFGKMNEDYEVCAAAKVVLEERGFIHKGE